MARRRVLIVDDDPALRHGMRVFLETRGYAVEEADSCRAAEESLRAGPLSAAVVDYRLEDGDALTLLPRLRVLQPDLPVIILTGYGSIDLAVRAIKEGAEQFLTKPVEMAALAVLLDRVTTHRREQLQHRASGPRATEPPDPFLGTSAAIRRLAEEARRVRDADSPILIGGETGSGKGVLARWLHDTGGRSDEPFVDLNCAGLSRELLESELFGHERGAFTGAVTTKTGLLDVADGGTLFLDEIGDVDPQVQPKLLKVLEDNTFRRLGDVRDRRVDVRLIAATHEDLRALVEQKRFRSDLYFRIEALPLTVPPLRERREDIAPLADHLLSRLAAQRGRPRVELSPEARRNLETYSWPGNIRELRNVLERALLLTDRIRLEPGDLRFAAPPTADAAAEDASLTLAELERRHIERVLREEGGQVARAAVRLGVPRSTFYQKLKTLGLPAKNGR